MEDNDEGNVKVLVTGGAGFIGSHLCERLLLDGNTVICLDNFNDFYSPEIKRDNISNIINNPRFLLIEGDIRDLNCLSVLFRNHTPDLVVHLAAMAGVRPSLENPSLYYDVNINGTSNLLEQCRLHGVRDFVFASSSSVYGNNIKVPFSESDSVDHPISPYAYTKKTGELLCHLYYHLYGMSIVALRFFTVYGPRQRPDLAIYKFTDEIVEHHPIFVYGNGQSRRDYTYIDDIIDGVMRSISFVTKNRCYEIFNLGESQPVTLCDMIMTIENALGITAEKKTKPMQPGDVEQTYADIEKSRKYLAYDPHTDFKDGIERFIKWYLEKKK